MRTTGTDAYLFTSATVYSILIVIVIVHFLTLNQNSKLSVLLA